MADRMVRVYDFEAKAMVSIPARELAPGMVKARVEGIEGEVWIDASKTKTAPLRHPPFSEEIRKQFRLIQGAFYDVAPKTLEAWEDGFRRDTHPDREIAIWLRLANVFMHFTEGRQLSHEQRKDIFHIILLASTNGRDAVLLTTNPLTLSKKRVQEILDFMFAEQN